MNRKLATGLLIPAIAAISVAAIAGQPQSGDTAYRRPHRTKVETHKLAVSPRNSLYLMRVRRPVRKPPLPKLSPAKRLRQPAREARAPAWRQAPGNSQGDRRDPPPQSRGYNRDRDSWGGPRYYYRGQPYWRINIRLFPRYGLVVWRRGYWYRGWHGGRWGWWWLAGGAWYYYTAPVYPYPNPYVPGTVAVVTSPASLPVSAQYWYYCNAPQGYYPYVPVCASGWTPVPANPAPASAPFSPGGG